MTKLTYFTVDEFDSPDLPGSGKNMDPGFLEKLDKARELAGISFVIASGYRTRSHNKKVGGVKDSSHCRGYAADIRVKNSTSRYKIIQALLAAGFTRIGVAATFIHVDNDPDKVEHVLWTY